MKYFYVNHQVTDGEKEYEDRFIVQCKKQFFLGVEDEEDFFEWLLLDWNYGNVEWSKFFEAWSNDEERMLQVYDLREITKEQAKVCKEVGFTECDITDFVRDPETFKRYTKVLEKISCQLVY
mgnify:FL=1